MPSNSTNLSTGLKAFRINSDPNKYGTFAEIGAGQEVARHFFQAGHASSTIAKSMSAYDMTFSDEIYGKEESGRYVCKSRLDKMLHYEFSLVNERLKKDRGEVGQFFSFANTVATNRGHGWMGIQFQSQPKEAPSTVSLHVKMLDNTRLQQAEVLGVLGVNLIYGAYELLDDPSALISSLTDNISLGRVEIDYISFEGPAFENVDNRLMCLELVQQDLTGHVVFDAQGANTTLADEYFHAPIFLLRGEFRPITKVNMELIELGTEEFEQDHGLKKNTVKPLLEITMTHLKREKGSVNKKDFLERVDTLSHLNLPVMISNHDFYYEVKQALRDVTDAPLASIIGGNQLDNFFDTSQYAHLKGGILEASSRLFDKNVSIYVFPYKTANSCASLKTYFAEEKTGALLNYLKLNGHLKDLSDCDEVEESVLSSSVRSLLLDNDSKWKELVPEKVAELIEKKGLFK